MPPLMQLPAYRLENTQLDTEPAINALMQNRAFGLQQDRMGMDRERLGMDRERFGMERQRFASQQEDAVRKRVGGLALLTMQEGDEAKRAEKWKQVLSLHPDAAKLGSHYGDHRTGPLALLADAGMADDYLKFQLQKQQSDLAARQAQIAQAQEGRAAAMHPGAIELQRAQIAQAQQRDELSGAKAAILKQLMPAPAPQMGAPAPRVVPQSYEAPGADPNMIPIQAPSQVQPRQPGVFDNLTPGQRAGVALGIVGMGDAGKIIADADPAALGKEAKNKIEERLLNTTESLARLNQISSMYKPEFQTIENRMGYAWTELLSKTRAGQAAVTPEQAQGLAEFAAFRADSVSQMNEYIKSITGATMTNAEAGRIEGAMPKVGTGVFDGDSPTSFKAKMDNAIRSAKLSLARNNYLRKNGFNGDVNKAAAVMPLERMNGIINQRAGAILRETQSQNPGINQQQLMPLVRQRLRAEFGIDA